MESALVISGCIKLLLGIGSANYLIELVVWLLWLVVSAGVLWLVVYLLVCSGWWNLLVCRGWWYLLLVVVLGRTLLVCGLTASSLVVEAMQHDACRTK